MFSARVVIRPRYSEQENIDLRVLLVEDDETTQLHIRTLLDKFGCRVSVVRNGETALTLLEEEEFDCVLMDIQSYGIGGGK